MECAELNEVAKTKVNRFCHPFIEEEGCFLKPLPTPPNLNPYKFWHDGLSPHDRLYYHQTLNSARHYACFIKSPLVPDDATDLALLAQYDHGKEIFGDKVDVVLQHETIGRKTFRRLRNTKDIKVVREDTLGHPLAIGGIKERISPFSVKMMNSGHHSALTNPGYSRQHSDGNYFNY